MNYIKLYEAIINNAKARDSNGYVEKHHIIPKSLGGSNEPDNLVPLTAREHFVCHYLLTKIYDKESIEYYKMLNAFIMMKVGNILQGRYFNSHLYEYARIEYAKRKSIEQSGNGNSQYGTVWIYNLNLQESKKIPHDKLIDYLSAGWNKGRKIYFGEKPQKIKICKNCGSEKCERPKICSKHQMIYTMINVFGFDKNKKGSVSFYAEFDRIVELIHREYHIEMKSTLELSEKYGISTQRIDSIFKSLGIKPRDHKDALKNYTKKRKQKI